MLWDLTVHGPPILSLLLPGFSQERNELRTEGGCRQWQTVVKTCLLGESQSKRRVLEKIWSAPGGQVFRTHSEQFQLCGEGKQGATDHLIYAAEVLYKRIWERMGQIQR